MFGVSFLSPLFLIGAAAAAIPIAIHLFYRRAEPVIEFAAMRYLRQAPVEESRRRRLRELLLLALRVTALVLLACAFARPYLAGAAASSGAATVVLIDTSASLSAAGQFERARERAAEVVRSAPATHEVAVLAFAQAADVIAPLFADRAGALAAIAQLTPGAGATRYRAALQRAGEELAGRGGRIVVVTDLQESGWDAATEAAIPEGVAVGVEEVDGPDANLAITSLRVEAGEAIAVVQNFSSRPAADQVVFQAEQRGVPHPGSPSRQRDGVGVARTLRVGVQQRRLGAVPVTLAPGGSAEARLALDGPSGGALVASISDRDGFLADNARYAVLDGGSAVAVLALTASGHPSEALYLERALAVSEGAGGFRFRAIRASSFSAFGPEALGDVDVLVVAGTQGLDERGRERLARFVRSGGGLLVTAGPDVDPAIFTQALAGIVSTSWRVREAALSFAPADGRHPVFRPFGGVGTLGHVRFTRAALVEAPEGAGILARYTDGTPALVEERTDAGRVLVFGSDLNHRWNDFPLQPAFVPFVHETIRYLAAPHTTRSEYLVGELPGAAGTAPGVVQLAQNQPRSRRVAVNTDPRESDPRRMPVEAFQAGISRLQASAARAAQTEARRDEDAQGLWWYGLLLLVVSLAAEGLLGRRLG
ncbi:MAG: BatA domain-containing protein [Acidobacteria bacterium]|nr:BatA domain-containing protein [Acidobacteriota bacterium]